MDCKVNIVSYSDGFFKDRREAGLLLAEELKDFSCKPAVVLGIPRGGIVVGKQISRILNADLDVALSHKLAAPFNLELAIGAITEDGKVFINEVLAVQAGAGRDYIEKEKQHRLSEIKEKAQAYRKVRPKVSLSGKIVIITDDGAATGSTMQAALWSARGEKPKKLIAAIPVASQDSIEKLKIYADELVCLRLPTFFSAVGQFYQEFEQVEERDVLEILEQEYRRNSNHESKS